MPDPLSPVHPIPETCEPPPGTVRRRPRSPAENLQRSLIGAVFGLGLGICTSYFVVKDSWHGFASLRWAQTQGVIQSTDVEHYWRRLQPCFALRVRYTYTVNGKQYENDRISFPRIREDGDQSLEEEVKARYRIGSRPTVYYDPADPANSCLKKGPNYFFTFGLGSLTALFLLGGSVCLASVPSALKAVAKGKNW
jgi:Protein of unknown function (DUF3592)